VIHHLSGLFAHTLQMNTTFFILI